MPHPAGRSALALLAAVATLAALPLRAAPPVVDVFSASATAVPPGGTLTATVTAHDPDCVSPPCTTGCGLYLRADLTLWGATGGSFPTLRNGTSGSPYAAEADWQAPAAEGTYTLSVTLSDSATFLCGGRQTVTAQLSVLVTAGGNRPPAIASLTAEPATIFPGGSSSLRCDAADPDGDPVTFLWETDLGAVQPGPDGTATFTASVPGIANITCRARDDEGGEALAGVRVAVSAAQAERRIAGLRSPQRLAVDALGRLVVVDSSLSGLVRFDPAAPEPVLELVPAAGATAVAVDWNGALVVAGTNGAYVLSEIGKAKDRVKALTPPAPLGAASAVAVDATRRRYAVVYPWAGRVVVFDAQRKVVASFGRVGDGAADLRTPLGVAFAPDGSIVVADSGHALVKVFSATGALLRSFGGRGAGAGRFVALSDVATDAAGLIYASDGFQSWVQVFEASGALRETFGGYGDGVGHLKTPSGVAVDRARGRVLVASLNGGCLQQYRTTGAPAAAAASRTEGADPIGIAAAPVGAPAARTLSVEDVRLPEGDAGERMALFRLTLSRPSDGRVSVAYRTRPDGADEGSDYGGTGGIVTFPAGATERTVAVPVRGDLLLEPDEERFRLELSAVAGARLSRPHAVASIEDDEPCEGPNLLASLGLSSEDGTPVDLTPYAPWPAARFRLEASPRGPDSGARLELQLLDDRQRLLASTLLAAPRLSEELTLPVRTSAARLRAYGTIERVALRSLRVPTVEVGDAEAYEDGGVLEVPLRMPCPVGRPVEVRASTGDGSAVEREDYLSAAGRVVFAPGETEAFLRVPLVSDARVEPRESIAIRLEPSGAEPPVLLSREGAVTVMDDDACPLPASTWARAVDGDDELRALLSDPRLEPLPRLRREAAAARLNLANGSPPSILPALLDAERLLASGEDDGGDELAETLGRYNDGGCSTAPGRQP